MNDAAEDLSDLRDMAAGLSQGLSRLYDRHAGVMLRVAFRLLGNRRDAEDLLHDVFLEVWRKADSYDPSRGSVRAWLLLRVRSRAIDRMRTLQLARRLLVAEDDAVPAPVGVVEDRAMAQVDCGTTRTALDRLPPDQKEVVELGYFHGLSCREIAERCQIPVGTVKSRLSAALEKLRRQLVPAMEDA